MIVGVTLVASLLVTLARPATWPLALAAFLLRGGFLLVLAPIIVLPTTVGLGNILTPLVTALAFRGFAAIALPLAAVGVAGLLWLVGGGVVAAAVESELVRRVAADDEAWPGALPPRGLAPAEHPAWRVVTVRLIAHVPLVLALSWGAIRIVAVAYRELTVPSDVAVALAIRVVGGAPDAVALVIAAWLLGETVGSLAARRVILLGEHVPSALGRAVVRLVRHPLRCVALALIPLLPQILVLAAVGIAASATWDALRAALSFEGEPLVTLALLAALVGLFSGGLLLIGVASTWRAAVWTADLAGTFGVAGHGPEGQWNGETESGTLSDLRPRGVDPDPR
jgi:hypothetical protein